MQIMYANMNADSDDAMIVQTEPFTLGNIKYFGCKKIFLKNSDVKDDSGNTINGWVEDKERPPEYDGITQLFLDSKNSNQLNSQAMLNHINQQRFNSQLMLDNMNLQKMTSQLMLEVNQLKNGGNK